MAGIAALHSQVGELVSGVNREFGLVFLAASGTEDAAEFPFAETETAAQIAASAVALLA